MNTIQCESEFWIRVPYMPDISLFNWINNIVFSSEFVFSHFTPCSFWYVTKTATFAAAGLATVWNAIRSSFTLPWGHYKNNVWTPETWHNRNWIDMQFRLGGHSNALFFPLHNSSMTHIYIYKCAIGCDCVVHSACWLQECSGPSTKAQNRISIYLSLPYFPSVHSAKIIISATIRVYTTWMRIPRPHRTFDRPAKTPQMLDVYCSHIMNHFDNTPLCTANNSVLQ